MECRYCNKVCKNDNSLRNHERLCKSNPERQILISNFIKYNEKLKNGLVTKEYSNQHIKAKLNGSCYMVSNETRMKLSNSSKGRVYTEEQKRNHSHAMRNAVLKNPDSYTANNVSGRTPIINYKNFKLKGTWELETAKWLDRQNIKWTTVKEGFDYFWEDSLHTYYPDFYLPEYDIFIEVKGYERERDKAKWSVVDNLFIIKKHEISLIKKNMLSLDFLKKK